MGQRSERMTMPVAVALGLAAALVVVTVVIIQAPGLRLQARAPNLRPALESAGAVAAGLTAGVAYVRLVLGGERVWLYVSVAFLVIAINRLVIGVLVPPDRIDAQTASYLWTAARLETGVLLLLGVVAARRGEPEPSPRPVYGAVALAALTVLAAIEVLLWLGRGSLPALSRSTEVFTGVQPGLTSTDIALGSTGAALFLLSGFLYAREPSLDRRNRTWLACVLVLAAFSHIHYMLVPTAFRDRVSTGDALRLAMSALLLLALVDDVRRAFTRERERGKELEAAYQLERVRVEELEALARTKADLLRMLSHELLHPVAAIRTLASGLAIGETKLDERDKRRAVQGILEQSEHLRDLVERSPHLHELRLDLEPAAVDQRVDQLLDHVRHTFPHLAQRLRVDAESDATDAVVRVDQGRIMQVFHNLLSNAEKFSPPESPLELSARCTAGDVVFEVRDRGPGIPPEEVERAFQPFVRLPNAEGTSGSGIGLYIVRWIVEAHGGRAWIDGEGTGGGVVAFALPRMDRSAA
jgi:signal transduction histidine kinase